MWSRGLCYFCPSDAAHDRSGSNSDGITPRSLRIRCCECPRQAFDVPFSVCLTDRTAAVVLRRTVWPVTVEVSFQMRQVSLAYLSRAVNVPHDELQHCAACQFSPRDGQCLNVVPAVTRVSQGLRCQRETRTGTGARSSRCRSQCWRASRAVWARVRLTAPPSRRCRACHACQHVSYITCTQVL